MEFKVGLIIFKNLFFNIIFNRKNINILLKIESIRTNQATA